MRTVILSLSFICCVAVIAALALVSETSPSTGMPSTLPGPLSSANQKTPSPSASIEGDWPVFRGDMGLRGYRSGSVGKSPKLLWRYDAETAIESTTAVVDGRVFVGTDEKGLLALGANDGKLLWSFPCEVGIRSSPGVLEGRVYFGDDEGIFRAVNAETGKLVWKFDPDTGAEIISSATFSGDLVLFGSYDASLYALDRRDGKLRWKVPTEGPVHCTPAVASGHTFVAGCDEQLRIIAIRSGSEISSVSMNAYSAASPAVLDDRLFVGTFGEQVICVRWRPGPEKRLAPTKPKSAAGQEAEESGTSAVEWAYEHPRRKFPYYSSPAVGPIDEPGQKRRWVVVIGGRDKMVHAIDADSGDSLWTFPTRAGVDGSPVIVGAHVIVGGLDGNIYCLDLKKGEEFWTYNAGTPFRSSPALARGKLFIASDEGLVYCFDLNPGK